MHSNEVRVRFAPSPTGYLHIGGARTALFNYLFAKANNGTFILRIEDTDLERSTDEAVEAIFDSLDWLGITADEGPFFQTKRFDLYQQYAQKLLSTGHAYRCYCTAEELEKFREERRAKKENPHYPGVHRPATNSPQPETLPDGTDEQPFVIRLRSPETGFAVFQDLVLGEIRTPYQEIDDFVIVRSDGTPTYNFVVVVDDIEMKMSHIIRGNDHVSNTPKQIAVYEALDAELPSFAHVPMILGPDKKKLSKRHGATSVTEYRDQGFLADAFVNYLARLGWSHGDQEIFTREELKRHFTLDNVGKSAAVFDPNKLLWVSAEHFKQADPNTLAALVCDELKSKGVQNASAKDDPQFVKLIESLVERAKTLVEMAEKCRWYFVSASELNYDEKAVKKHLKAAIKEPLTELITELESLEHFSEDKLEPLFHQICEKHEIKLGKLAQPVRVSLTGTSVSPPIFTVLEIVGQEESLARLKRGLTFFS